MRDANLLFSQFHQQVSPQGEVAPASKGMHGEQVVPVGGRARKEVRAAEQGRVVESVDGRGPLLTQERARAAEQGAVGRSVA